MRIKDKVAVVTGAASGIGKEIARTFVREGAKVVIADLNKDGAIATAAELGGDAVARGVAMDVTNEAQVDAGIDEAAAAFGGIDILVSNAGIQIVSPHCGTCTPRAAAAASSTWAPSTPRRRPS